MAEYTREQKLKILENLPEDLQDLIESEDTGAILLSLGIKYNLADDKVRLLSKIVGNVALGLLPLINLSQELNAKITPDMQTALNLAQELNVELFFPVMESLKQAPIIANAVLTGQPIPTVQISTPMPAPMPVPAAPMAPIKPAQPTLKPTPYTLTPRDQYREPAEAISGPLKPKIGPEPMSAPRPIAPPVVTLQPLETMAPPKPVASAPAPMPAPMPVPQPITAEGGTPPQAVVKIPIAPAPAIPRPLTFTRSVMPSGPKLDSYREPVEFAPLPVPPQLPTEEMAHPTEKSQIPQVPTKQFIASPTESSVDLEEPASDIVDLRQDKGRF